MRLIIKVGTNVLADDSGSIVRERILNIAREILDLWNDGHEVILVTSGAIGTGRMIMPNFSGNGQEQVWAAIGQPELMKIYSESFRLAGGLTIGQCLLLRNDFTDRERYNNSVRTIIGLLKAKVLPVINENDVVASGDLSVGDNDIFAAMLAIAVKADTLILLTNQEGLYTGNPDINRDVKLLREVTDVDVEIERLCSPEISELGRGGMLSKVRAAKHAVNAGIATFIADGRKKRILQGILAGTAIATHFVPKHFSVELSDKKRWLMSAKGFGQLIVDEGAIDALHNGKSLLLPGLVGAKGLFDKGEIVEVVSKVGTVVAYGKVNYSYNDIQRIFQKRKANGEKNVRIQTEVIHRNYMVVLK